MKLLLILLYPFTFVYKLLFYLDRLIKKDKYSLPNSIVISVGNLSAGGTGKTPFTIYIANILNELYPNTNITILSRGYKGAKSKQGMKVELDSDPKDCGDEPLLIKKTLPFVNVIIGRNRYHSFLKHSNSEKQIVILDDGFQHHSIKRQFDFVLIDSDAGFGNGMVIPAGFLREGVSALNRSSCIIFTKAAPTNQEKRKKLLQKIRKQLPDKNIIQVGYKPLGYFGYGNQFLSIGGLKNKKVFAFSGIGNPESFIRLLKEENPSQLDFQQYMDHFDYSTEELWKLDEKAKGYDYVICTEKDYVKISKESSNLNNLYYLKVEVEALEVETLKMMLKSLINFII